MPILASYTKIEGLPANPVGPFSQGVAAEGKFLFVSGQGPYDPQSDTFIRGSIAEQTRLTLACVKRVAEKAGGNINNVVSCRVYLQPLTDETFAEMNTVYKEFFGDHRPSRTTIGVTLGGIDVEIDCVVLID